MGGERAHRHICQVYFQVPTQTRRMSDLPELEVVTGGCEMHDIGAGNQTRILVKNSKF